MLTITNNMIGSNRRLTNELENVYNDIHVTKDIQNIKYCLRDYNMYRLPFKPRSKTS